MGAVIVRFERFLDRAVPWLVIALIPFIIISFFVDHTDPVYRLFSWFDWFVMGAIALDLLFKAYRSASVRGFLGSHWFAIASLVPVFLVLRVFEELALFVDAIQGIQDAGSEVSAIQRQSSRNTLRTSRMRFFSRLARPLARMPRLARAAEFFHHPDARSKKVRA